MTSNLLEDMQVYLVTQAVTRYCTIYFGNSSKIGTCFQNKLSIKKSDVENLMNLVFISWAIIKPCNTKVVARNSKGNNLGDLPCSKK